MSVSTLGPGLLVDLPGGMHRPQPEGGRRPRARCRSSLGVVARQAVWASRTAVSRAASREPHGRPYRAGPLPAGVRTMGAMMAQIAGNRLNPPGLC